MQIETIIKAVYAIQAGCTIAMVGIGIHSLTQQKELNQTIAEGTRELAHGNKMMQEFITSIK